MVTTSTEGGLGYGLSCQRKNFDAMSGCLVHIFLACGFVGEISPKKAF